MEMIIGQLRYFGASFVCGVGFMFLYDFILLFRRKIKHGKIWCLTEDWMFWCLAAILVFQMIFALNNGILRSFFVLSFMAGMYLYKKLVKDYVIRGILSFFRLIFRPCVWIMKKIQGIQKKSLK